MNRIVIIIITILFLFFQIIPCFAQDNPFFSKNSREKEKQIVNPVYPRFIQVLVNSINNLQRVLNERLSALSRKINEENDSTILYILLGIALIYGIIHALGPGHGKIIIVSYTISNPLKIKQGIILSAFVAIIHTLSAVFLVSILYFILKKTYSGYSREPKRIISLISYGLIAGMGIFLLVKTIFADVIKFKNNNENTKTKVNENDNNIRKLIVPALIIGLIPCEGAILILIFSISIGSYWLGIILSIVMSIGMALTISLIGLITIYSRKVVLKLVSANTGTIKIISNIIQIIGAVIIFIFGLLLFISRL